MTSCLPTRREEVGAPPPDRPLHHPRPGIYNAVLRSDLWALPALGTGHRLGIQNAPAGGPLQITDHRIGQEFSCTSKCRKAANLLPHLALAPRSVGAASGTDAGRCLAGSLGAARLPTRRRAAMAPPQRLPLLGSRPGAAEIGAPSHRLQHPRGTAVLPTPSRPANTIGRAVVKAAPLKCRRRRAVP